LPSGPSIFYSASINAPALTVYAGDFSGSSTSSFNVQPGLYANGQQTDLEVPFSVALGPNGNVYTLETAGGASTTTATVAEYLPNFNCMGPVATLNGLPPGGSSPGSVAVDAAGYVYVATQTPRQLALYAPLAPGAQAPQPLATISIPAAESASSSRAQSDPIGIKLDASGRIYIADGYENSVLVYPARSGATLSATPSATIAGSTTSLDTPVDVAVDASDKIYVVDDDYPYGVKIFAANPSGITNEAPTARIGGSLTEGFYFAASVAVDHLGEIYFGYAQTPVESGIVEYPPNPSGTVNEAPQGMLSGANPTGLVAK
jgi:biopolymer transport protein ExbD